MRKTKDYVPFRDPQLQPPRCRCPKCGREVYGDDGVCLYCQTYDQ